MTEPLSEEDNPLRKLMYKRDRMQYLKRLQEWNKLKNDDNTETKKEYEKLGQECINLESQLLQDHEKAKKLDFWKNQFKTSLGTDDFALVLSKALNYEKTKQMHTNCLEVIQRLESENQQLKQDLEYWKNLTTVSGNTTEQELWKTREELKQLKERIEKRIKELRDLLSDPHLSQEKSMELQYWLRENTMALGESILQGEKKDGL